MDIADLNDIAGRTYPARRRTQNLVGGASPIQAEAFAMGHVTLEPNGGQVPWHNQQQEEVYYVVSGRGEMCLGDQRRELTAGQAVYIPSGQYHQLTNIGSRPLTMIYVYGPAGDVDHWKQELAGTLLLARDRYGIKPRYTARAGDVDHWKQELAGTLPVAGQDVPPLPEGAWPQCTEKPTE